MLVMIRQVWWPYCFSGQMVPDEESCWQNIPVIICRWG